ncbi:MAG: hypothetical protein COV67_13875 [Nitrospinae bacterium CG11_big_fil_rev_8_21_14_0_20_56_8]|nr:MAG: hypothetical protein COV67_13875 [Nitrospinae bacterium CG11_big_fil_rev_8_21_14_0_20_56_8]
MVRRILNLFRLARILRERGNWPLIRRSKRQLRDFILGQSGMHRSSVACALWHGFYMLKSLDVLVWRLETFGFLFPPHHTGEDRKQLNRYL